MQIRKGDILIRKEKGLNAVWLSEAILLQYCEGLSEGFMRTKARFMYRQSVSPCFRDKAILPDTGKAWRYGRIDGQFYYAYANVPDKAPTHYKTQLPSKEELIALERDTVKETSFTDLESLINAGLKDNYISYLPAYSNCTDIQKNNLAKAASFVEASVLYIGNTGYDTSKNDLFRQLSDIIEKLDLKYLPANYRRLKETIMKVVEGSSIAETIKLPRAGNANASVFCNDNQLIGMIYQLASMQQNYADAFIIRKIQDVCELIGKEAPSDRWIGGKLESHNLRFLTAKNRFGDKGRGGVLYTGYVPVEGALFAGDCWQIDGTRFNIIDHKTSEGKNAFLYIVVVRDVHSGDALGWHFSYTENHVAVLNALRMAVKETGYVPYEIVCDRFPGHNTEQMKNFFEELTQRGVKISVTHKATGKAQQERWFGTLQTVFMQESDYYYGEGIKSRRRFSHRSVEYVAAMRKQAKADGWDFDAASNHANEIVERYRNTKYSYYSRKHKNVHRTPAELHTESEKPNVMYLNEAEMTYLFGLKKTIALKNQGLIKTEILNTEYFFQTTDYSIVSKYNKVIMCYDLEDLSHVHLYAPGKKALSLYLGIADHLKRAQVFGPDAKYNDLGKQESIIKNIQEQREQELNTLKQAAGFDVNLLLAGHASKGDYEQAESNYLRNEWDDDTVSINVRKQY